MSAKTDQIKQEHASMLVSRLVADIESASGQGWIKPWATSVADRMPFNASTGNSYRGVNVWYFALAAQNYGYSGGQWATYKQWQKEGGQVQKGQKGVKGLFSKPIWVNEDNKRCAPDTPGARRLFVSNAFTVFHRDQTDLPPEIVAEKAALPPSETIDLAEQIIMDHGIPRTYGGDRAVTFSRTRVQIPYPRQFHSELGFLTTSLHEAAHWTGHSDRLDRHSGAKFGTPEYAREELTVELATVLMAARLGFGPEGGHHAQSAEYIKNWLQGGSTDRIYDVLNDANKIADFLVPQGETP